MSLNKSKRKNSYRYNKGHNNENYPYK